MRVTMVIPGSGGAFYCQNCVRDTVLFSSLEAAGVSVSAAPMYLSREIDHDWPGNGRDVFFGAVNVYLQEKMSLFRHTPRWLDHVLDSPAILDWAARRSGSTKASKLGDMTLSMLRGTKGHQAKELRRLCTWLRDEARPDVVFLSNGLLLGLVPEIKDKTSAAVVCALQDEAPWIDAFEEPARSRCWNEMVGLASSADSLVAVSEYYAAVMSEKLRLPPGRIVAIPPGIDTGNYRAAPSPPPVPTVGFLSRSSSDFGLDTLAEAVVELASDPALQGLKLAVSGGSSGPLDDAFLGEVRAALAAGPGIDSLVEVPHFDLASRVSFLGGLTAFCVPSRVPEAFGMQVLEAVACGVPVVMPDLGAYREIIETTGGGFLFDPGDHTAMTGLLRSLLTDPDLARRTGEIGRGNALERYSGENSAKAFMEIFKSVTSGRTPARA